MSLLSHPDHQETIHWSQWFLEDEEQTYCWRISINSWIKGKPPRFSSSSKFCKGFHGLYTEHSQQSHTEDLSIWGSKLIKHQLENFLTYSYFPLVYVNNSYSLGDEWNTNSLGFSDEEQIWRKIIKLWIVNKIVINYSDKLRCYLKNLNFKLSGTGKPLYQQLCINRADLYGLDLYGHLPLADAGSGLGSGRSVFIEWPNNIYCSKIRPYHSPAWNSQIASLWFSIHSIKMLSSDLFPFCTHSSFLSRLLRNDDLLTDIQIKFVSTLGLQHFLLPPLRILLPQINA